MHGDKFLTITIDEKVSDFCRVKLGMTPKAPLEYVAYGVFEVVDQFRANWRPPSRN